MDCDEEHKTKMETRIPRPKLFDKGVFSFFPKFFSGHLVEFSINVLFQACINLEETDTKHTS